MSRRSMLGVCLPVVVGLLVGLASVAGSQAGPPLPDEALFQAHVEAGEFAPALAMARRAGPERRDAWLTRIAAAQARAGAREASLSSAADIGDDRTRANALSQIAAQPLGGRGGGAMADFDSLIDLIVSTIAPDSWDDVGGPGSIAPFPSGVYVDPDGVLRRLAKRDDTGNLANLHASSAERIRQKGVRDSSPLRKVSLPRLEKQIQLRLAMGKKPGEEMRVLAGLQRVEYVFVYPDSGDLVLAGPAGDWRTDRENRVVGTTTGLPLVRLDDLVVMLRRMIGNSNAQFGCLIAPRQEALASVQAFLTESGDVRFEQPGDRTKWLEQIRSCLGQQDIEVFGLDPRTRAARVLVEADYRMKLVGMGLEEGVPGLRSYLEMVRIPPGGSPPPMDVLRWWFTLDYDAVLSTEDGQAFAVRGQGVKVLSENELLAAQGKRIHTGKSDELNSRFASSFTQHFGALCREYPVYAELRNVCDLALVAALIREQDLPGKIGWHLTCFGENGGYPVEFDAVPKTVETIANHRVTRSGKSIHTLAGVSGGVSVDPARLVAREAIEFQRYGPLEENRSQSIPRELPTEAWWWD